MLRPFLLYAALLVLPPGLAVAQAQAPARSGGLLATPRVMSRQARTDQLEIRIRDLHSRLRVTPAEEPQWTAFADIMRANAREMGELYRAGDPRTMSAMEALQHYARIARAHANEIDNLMAPFQALYDAMDAAQKKLTDETFHSFGQRGGIRG